MEISNSNIKSSLVGFVVGMFSFAGGEALYEKYFNTPQQAPMSGFMNNYIPEQTPYERLKNETDGEVYVTPKGKKYHNSWCSTLKRIKNYKCISLEDAINTGYEPCSRCN